MEHRACAQEFLGTAGDEIRALLVLLPCGYPGLVKHIISTSLTAHVEAPPPRRLGVADLPSSSPIVATTPSLPPTFSSVHPVKRLLPVPSQCHPVPFLGGPHSILLRTQKTNLYETAVRAASEHILSRYTSLTWDGKAVKCPE